VARRLPLSVGEPRRSATGVERQERQHALRADGRSLQRVRQQRGDERRHDHRLIARPSVGDRDGQARTRRRPDYLLNLSIVAAATSGSFTSLRLAAGASCFGPTSHASTMLITYSTLICAATMG